MSSVPLVKFNNTLVNLTDIQYVRISTGQDHNNFPEFKLIIQFREAHSLTWSYKERKNAQDAMDELFTLNQTYMMAELP